jgi:hypothetical protein
MPSTSCNPRTVEPLGPRSIRGTAQNSPSNTGNNVTISLTGVTSATTRFGFLSLEGATSGGGPGFLRGQLPSADPSDLPCTKCTYRHQCDHRGRRPRLGPRTEVLRLGDLEIGSVGFTPTGTPTVNDVASHPYTWAGGAASSSYSYYVRSDCGMDQCECEHLDRDHSTSVLPVELFNVPYTQDFNSATPPAMPNCWSVENVNGSNTWITRRFPFPSSVHRLLVTHIAPPVLLMTGCIVRASI